MPTKEYAAAFYGEFGVQGFHQQGHFGAGVSIYLIDTGLTNTESRLKNVHNRTVSNAMGARNTHGSFVASIVAAKASEDGTSGIAPDAQVYLADVSGHDGVIYTSRLVKAVRDAVDLHVDIISISLGTSVYDESLEKAIKAAEAKGILVFAAAGNCGCRSYEFPSACESAISVASINRNRMLSAFNTRNDAVAVFAPGENIAVPGSARKLSGTSFAVPFASALMALELSKRRRENPEAKVSRSEAITFLRQTLRLDKNLHTYAQDVTGGQSLGSFQPTVAEGISYFLILAGVSGGLALYGAGLYTGSRTCSIAR